MALAVGELLPRLSPREILTVAEQRIKQHAIRDALYDVYALYYRGEQPSKGSFDVLAMNSQGRPLLRDLGKAMNMGRAYSSQRLAPIVDDFQALIGRMPNSRVEPPEASAQGEHHAEMGTKFLISTHELSDMDHQWPLSGFHLSGLGDACLLLEVEPEVRRVVWSAVEPRAAYPTFYSSYRRFQIYDLVIRVRKNPDAIHRDYGFMPKEDSDDCCTVTTYLSPFQRTVVVGLDREMRLGPDVTWDLGFCPAVWVFNKINGMPAQSDIGQSLGQQDFLDFAYNVLIDGLVHMVYPLVGIKNAQNVGQDQWAVGPGAPPISLQEDGDIIVRPLAGSPGPALEMIQQTIQDIHSASGTSEVRQQGQMKSSITTGRAVHAVQGPMSTRVELRQQNLGASLRAANAMTLTMQTKAPLLGKHKFEIFGRYGGKSFNHEMSGEDLQWNGKVWVRNSVVWDAMVGMNAQQKTAVAYEGNVAGLWSKTRAMEISGMVEDPLEELKRIETDKIREGEIEARVQQAMQGMGAPQPGQPQQGAGQPGASPPPGGGGTAPPSAPSPAPLLLEQGHPQTGAQPGAAGGLPLGTSRKTLETALAVVADKLKGAVYAVGDLALHGQAMRVTLAIVDHRDQSLVAQTARTVDPRASVRYVPADKLPTEAVRLA